MRRLLAWLANVFSTALLGPGSVVLGDAGFDPPPPRAAGWSHWAYRAAPVLLVLAIALVLFASAPWPIVVLAVLIVLFPVVASVLRDLRRPRS